MTHYCKQWLTEKYKKQTCAHHWKSIHFEAAKIIQK
jgi:hypothetical protein